MKKIELLNAFKKFEIDYNSIISINGGQEPACVDVVRESYCTGLADDKTYTYEDWDDGAYQHTHDVNMA